MGTGDSGESFSCRMHVFVYLLKCALYVHTVVLCYTPKLEKLMNGSKVLPWCINVAIKVVIGTWQLRTMPFINRELGFSGDIVCLKVLGWRKMWVIILHSKKKETANRNYHKHYLEAGFYWLFIHPCPQGIISSKMSNRGSKSLKLVYRS